jgi:hypothetical protein
VDVLAAVPLAALMAGVLLELLLGRLLSPRAEGWVAFGSGLTALAGALALLPPIVAGRPWRRCSSRGTGGSPCVSTWTA